MKKLLAMMVAATLLLSLAACTNSQVPTTQPTEITQPTEEQEVTYPTVENPVTYFSLSWGDAEGNYYAMTAYTNETGGAYVEYVGQEKKVGTFDLSVLHGITAQIDSCGLAAFHGQDAYEDGPESASMYITFQDESMLAAGYSGTIPSEFMEAYNQMELFFQTLCAKLPVYVPMPIVNGQVNQDVLTEMNQLMKRSGIEPLDMFTINDVPLDELFGATVGLTSTEGIANATICVPMMMPNAYSLVIVTTKSLYHSAEVRKDFAANIDWDRWVCVSADHALIAQKNNMVLCLVGTGDQFELTARAIKGSSWQFLETITP